MANNSYKKTEEVDFESHKRLMQGTFQPRLLITADQKYAVNNAKKALTLLYEQEVEVSVLYGELVFATKQVIEEYKQKGHKNISVRDIYNNEKENGHVGALPSEGFKFL